MVSDSTGVVSSSSRPKRPVPACRGSETEGAWSLYWWRNGTRQLIYYVGAMPTDPNCEECAAILLEYERTCLDFWLNASEETREGCRAIGQLVARGTETDLARAQELLPAFRAFKPYVNADARMSPSRMASLWFRKFQHEARTGHYLSLRPPSLRPLPPSDLS
jgi:hypothetical protein